MAYLNNKIKAFMVMMLLCGSMQFQSTPAPVANLPTMAAAGITDPDLAFSDTREGIVMQVLGNNPLPFTTACMPKAPRHAPEKS